MSSPEDQRNLDDLSSDEDFFLLGSRTTPPEPSPESELGGLECALEDDFPTETPDRTRHRLSAASIERRRRRSRRLWARFGPTWSLCSPNEQGERQSPSSAGQARAALGPLRPSPHRVAQTLLEKSFVDEQEADQEQLSTPRLYQTPEGQAEDAPSLEQLLRRRRRPIATADNEIHSQSHLSLRVQPNQAYPTSNDANDDEDDDIVLVAEYPARQPEVVPQPASSINLAPAKTRPRVSGRGNRTEQMLTAPSTSGQSNFAPVPPLENSLGRYNEMASRRVSRSAPRQKHEQTGSCVSTASAQPGQTPKDTPTACSESKSNLPIPITIIMQGLSEPVHFTAFRYTILDEIFASFARMHGFDWQEDPLQFYRETDTTPILSGTRAIDLALRPGEVIRATLSSASPSAISAQAVSKPKNPLMGPANSTGSLDDATWLRIRHCSDEEPRRYPFPLRGPAAAPLNVLFSRFCQDIGVNEERVVFLDPDGEPLDPYSTAADAGLEPDDLIEARISRNER